jgi:hypothetical protein
LTNIKINTGAGDKDFAEPELTGDWDKVEQPFDQQ